MNKPTTTCIVDDDEVYIMGVKRMITRNHLCDNVLVFENGQQALAYISSPTNEMPDTILLDINMPVMDGWQFLDGFSKVKTSLSKDIIIYMVSSSIDQNDMERAKRYSDVREYIEKPLTAEELKRLIIH